MKRTSSYKGKSATDRRTKHEFVFRIFAVSSSGLKKTIILRTDFDCTLLEFFQTIVRVA